MSGGIDGIARGLGTPFPLNPAVFYLCWSIYSVSVFKKYNLDVHGHGEKTILFAHGYGCDQTVWRFVAPAFSERYRVVLCDYVGAGKSDCSQYSRQKYGTLDGYAEDVLEIIEAVQGAPVIFVGHSVSSLIGVLAAIKKPEAFESLVLVGPSPCYINDGTMPEGSPARTSKVS